MPSHPVFKRLHRELKIPRDYYRASVFNGWGKIEIEARPPVITSDHRATAIEDLASAGLVSGTTEEALIASICARIGARYLPVANGPQSD